MLASPITEHMDHTAICTVGGTGVKLLSDVAVTEGRGMCMCVH